MKKILISALLLTAGLLSSAQIVKVESVTKVNLPQGTVVMTPTISPDGTFVVYSQQGNSSLESVDLATGKTTKLTDNGSDYNLSITADGNNIVFRQKTIDKNGLSRTALKSVSKNGGAEKEIVKATRNLEGVSVVGSNVNAIEKGKTKKKNLGNASAVNQPTVSIQYGHLNVTVNGKTTTIDPQGRSSYLWPQLSPDGKKIVYWVAYQGCFVCNLDGSDPVSLGELRAAKWMDNNTVVGMLDKDNGHQITSSELIAKTTDGKVQQLTPDTIIALYPSVSADGTKVAFASEKGELYILNLVK